MASKEVAVKQQQTSAVTVIDDDLLSAGTGLENVSSDDMAIPYLMLLQALSPQLNKQKSKYVEGAQQGEIYNSVTGETFDGDEGIVVIPCFYQKKYVEWTPRESGGGIVESHDSREILAQTTKNDRGQQVLSNGNYIAETAYFYVMVCNEDESEWSQALVSMTSTQLPKAKKWISQMTQRKVQNSAGEMVNAPMFMFKYRLKSNSEQNDRGSWYGWSIGLEGPTQNPVIMQEGKRFLQNIKGGNVKVQEDPDADQNSSSKTDFNDEVPF